MRVDRCAIALDVLPHPLDCVDRRHIASHFLPLFGHVRLDGCYILHMLLK